MRVQSAIALILITANPLQGPPRGFVCVPDQATGFKLDTSRGRWQSATFETPQRYIVTPASGVFAPYVRWEVRVAGDSTPTTVCMKDFNAAGAIECEPPMRFM